MGESRSWRNVAVLVAAAASLAVVSGSALAADRFGSDGNDTLRGTNSSDRIYGYGGNDSLAGFGGKDGLDGGSGNDHLFGGSSNDLLVGGTGADYINGGSGRDIVSYAGHDTPVHIDLRHSANNGGVDDGPAGSRDYLRRIEGAEGGLANDVIIGNSGRNNLDGLSGNDEIHGLGGRDIIFAIDGIDRVYGASGGDFIWTRDNDADFVLCGTGTDTVIADEMDHVASDCERVSRRD